MGQLAGFDLQGDEIGSGGAFELRQLCRTTGTFQLDDWTVSVRGGSKLLVVHAPIELGIDQIFPVALAQANLGLDYLCGIGACDATLDRPYNESLTWSLAGSEVTMRATRISPGEMSMSAEVTVRDMDGNEIPQPSAAPPQLHDALRFIRMARTGEVLFDAYRNMFLAMEAVLHYLYPQQGIGEGAWFRNALAHVDSTTSVTSSAVLAPAGESNPIQWAYDNIYSDLRSGLMHAKRDYHLPGDEARRSDIERSFNALWQYTRALMNHTWGTRLESGGFSEAGWKGAASYFETVQLIATNDPTVLSPEGGLFVSADSDKVSLTSGSTSYPEDYLGVVDGVCSGDALRVLGRITRVGAMDETGQALLWAPFEPDLLVGSSVESFQFRVGWRYANPNSIRSHFRM